MFGINEFNIFERDIMKYSKLIGIFLLVCIAITFLGVASAAEVTINGEKFNIPDGFVKDEELSSVSKSTYGTDEIALFSKDFDSISISVTSLNSGTPNLPTDEKYSDKTVNGIAGKYCEDADGKEFIYNDGQRTITIWLPKDTNVTFESLVVKTTSEEDSGSPFNIFG